MSHRLAVALSLAGVLTLALWAGTQFFVWRAGYPQGVYRPDRIVQWYRAWPNNPVSQQAAAIGLMFAAVGMLGVTVRHSGGNRHRINTKLHGSARWATIKDVKKAKLLGDKGPFVGAVTFGGVRYYLRDGGPTHIAVLAPTRGGKGVAIVVPTMLSVTESVFAIDTKGELYALSAGWRAKHANQRVLKWSPSVSGFARWNVMNEIRMGTDHEAGDIQNLAQMLAAPNGEDISQDHWKTTAAALLVGVIAFALRSDDPSLPGVANLLSDPARPFKSVLREMMGSGIELAARAARVQLDRGDSREASGVKSTADSLLTLYADPVVAENCRYSDFFVRDLMHGDRPMSLYICIEPSDEERMRPLVRLLLSATIRNLATGLKFRFGRPVKNYKHPLLLMLDELPALKRLGILEDTLPRLAGYGIRVMLIAQDIAQLREVYGKNESLTANCAITIGFQPNKIETAELFSAMCGDTTVINDNISRSHKAMAMEMSGSVSTSKHEVRRRLLTVDEIMRLPGPVTDGADKILEPGEMLIFVNGRPAIRGVQPLYFQDPILAARAAVPPP